MSIDNKELKIQKNSLRELEEQYKNAYTREERTEIWILMSETKRIIEGLNNAR